MRQIRLVPPPLLGKNQEVVMILLFPQALDSPFHGLYGSFSHHARPIRRENETPRPFGELQRLGPFLGL